MLEISAHFGMKGVRVYSGLPHEMLTFTLSDPAERSARRRCEAAASCGLFFLLLSISAASNSQGERTFEKKRSEGYKEGLSRQNGIVLLYS